MVPLPTVRIFKKADETCLPGTGLELPLVPCSEVFFLAWSHGVGGS
jgi:hypothetical protein